MPYERTIAIVRKALQDAFDDIDRWFDRPEMLRTFRPAAGGWMIGEVLEHVTLTNHFLMLTFRKWVAIALRRARRGVSISEGESDLSRLDVIGQRGSFRWDRPEHMEPTGRVPSEVVRATLRQQAEECLRFLNDMPHGEGSLCRIRMTVNDLGKIDLYQWVYFIAQHARRHGQQMGAIESEYNARFP